MNSQGTVIIKVHNVLDIQWNRLELTERYRTQNILSQMTPSTEAICQTFGQLHC